MVLKFLQKKTLQFPQDILDVDVSNEDDATEDEVSPMQRIASQFLR